VTARERRLVRGAGFLIVVAFLGFKALPAAMTREHALRDRVVLRERQVSSIRQDLAALGVLEDSAAAVRRAVVALAPRLLAAPTHADGDATLAVLVRALAERAGAHVERVVALPDSAAVGTLRRHTVRLELESDAPGLETLLRAIADETTLLEADSFRLTALEPSSPASQPERLRTAMIVRAWGAMRATTTDSVAGP
jgi:hypothetical protein